ncbi:MAG: hypothetical protein QM617_09135 [Comamonas sp.]
MKAAPTLHINPLALPPSLRELVRVLGEGEALRLVSQYGGTRLPSLRAMSAEHPCRVFLGEAVYAKLLDAYGAETVELPKCDGILRELRHDVVRQCRAQGLSIDETAEATGYSRRHVINILGGSAGGADVYTMDLFQDPAAPPAGRYTGTASDPFGLAARVAADPPKRDPV